jgi:hypothetical protein
MALSNISVTIKPEQFLYFEKCVRMFFVQNMATARYILRSSSLSTHRDSSVGTATRYWLNVAGIESRLGVGARFSAPVRSGPETHPASYTMGRGSLPGVKWPGRGVDHPPNLIPRLKEEYSYTSTPRLGLLASSRVTFTFTSPRY